MNIIHIKSKKVKLSIENSELYVYIKVIKVLLKYNARRIQKSVFIVQLNYGQLKKIETATSTKVKLNPITDHVMFIQVQHLNSYHFQAGHDCNVNSYFGYQEILFI